MRYAELVTEDEIADLKADYSRLKRQRDQLERDIKEVPKPDWNLDLANDATFQRQQQYHRRMQRLMTNRLIDMNHDLEVLKANIRAAKHRGTPDEMFIAYDSQKTGYERVYLNKIGQMIDRADADLPYPASDAITSFVGHGHSRNPEAGTVGIMAEERLEDAYSDHPSDRGKKIRQHIDRAFAPIRDALRRLYGDTITIYRAQERLKGDEKRRHVLSWTSRLDFAQSLLGAKRDLLTKQIAIDDIVWITDRANQAEFIVRNT